jgi:hypothetical protein
MCTYLTEKVGVTGSGKGAAGWFSLSEATVYFDHPVHAPAEHTVNIDARALAAAIEATLAAAPPGLA